MSDPIIAAVERAESTPALVVELQQASRLRQNDATARRLMVETFGPDMDELAEARDILDRFRCTNHAIDVLSW